MKGLFSPNHRSASRLEAVESGSASEQPQPLVLESNVNLDADVSMDESHASAMSGVTTESMTIGSPPRTQRKKRNSNGFRSILSGPPPQASNAADGGVSVRSRLFPEDADLKPPSRDNSNDHPSLILKPFDLNQQFANSADPPFNNNTSSPNSPTGRRPSTLTPFRRRLDGQATLRKRQADQDDLYGREWICDANDDAFSAAESPVDMYTSPRISPSKSAKHRTAMHRSPFYSKPKSQSQQLQYTKSPSHFQTLDGRTVQSKNPFSPMVFDDTPTPTPGRPVHSPQADPATALGLTHPLLLTSESLSESTSAAGGKSPFLLRSKLQKRGTSPSHSNKDNNTVGRSSTARMGMGIDGLTRNELRSNTADDDKQKLEQKTSKYIRDGYPEPTGRYSFTGSPIKENFATNTSTQSQFATEASSFPSKPLPTDQKPTALFASNKEIDTSEDYCTNIHKVRRKSKGDDVVAAAAQGESSWKKELYINTKDTSNEVPSFLNFDNNNASGFYNTIPNKSYFYNQQKKNQKEDSISPTDVFNFPQFRASPSDTSTLPPTPSKPVRRPPIRRYTPIRKTTGPPPTPMPGARQPRTFGLQDINSNNNVFDEIGGESSDDENASDRVGGVRRRRRPKSDASMGKALPPSRFYSDFDVIAELGSGSFGNVYKVLSRLDGCFYAIKVANRVAKGIADRDRMLKEVYALAALSDRADTATFHIVRYHQAWMEEERLYIQTELCTTTLQAEMKLAAPGQLPLATRFKCLREILLALNFIHNNQMVHLDIKPENIFLKNDQFKLGDFGLVSKVSSHDVEEGDSRYMSMELLSGDHADLTKSDIFSLGIAMYEICLGNNKILPSNGSDWQALRSGRILPPPNTTDELFQIIKKMMNPTYSERPSASDLLKLPELMSAEQKMMARERERLMQASQALALRPSLPKPKGLVRRNTWSAF